MMGCASWDHVSHLWNGDSRAILVAAEPAFPLPPPSSPPAQILTPPPGSMPAQHAGAADRRAREAACARADPVPRRP